MKSVNSIKWSFASATGDDWIYFTTDDISPDTARVSMNFFEEKDHRLNIGFHIVERCVRVRENAPRTVNLSTILVEESATTPLNHIGQLIRSLSNRCDECVNARECIQVTDLWLILVCDTLNKSKYIYCFFPAL